jgi:chitinase
MDWEPEAACKLTAAGPNCPTDAESINVAIKLRSLFPKRRYILSTASVHVGMYGEGLYKYALPVSAWTGLQLALAKSAGGLQHEAGMF